MNKITFVWIVVFILSACLLTSCGLKDPETTGIITHENGVAEDDSIIALQKMAESDPAAAYDMGLRYLKGDGVPQNSYKALQSLRAAGEKGDIKAQAALGKLYLSGLEEMGSDAMEAAKWLRLAASKGDKESATLLKKAEDARQEDTDNYVDPTLQRWYWRVSYRLHWYEGQWLYN